MTTERQKEIEVEAKAYRESRRIHTNFLSEINEAEDGYIAAATKYEAEIDAKDIALKELHGISDERDSWNKISVDYAIALEKAEKIIEVKDQEIQRLRAEAKDAEEIANDQWSAMRDIAESFKLRFNEKKEQLATQAAELTAYKEVSAKMAEALNATEDDALPTMLSSETDAKVTEVLSAYRSLVTKEEKKG